MWSESVLKKQSLNQRSSFNPQSAIRNPQLKQSAIRNPKLKRIGTLLVVLLFTSKALPAPERADIEAKYKDAAGQLVCQCGCHEQLTVCGMQNCHSATPMRAEIREKLEAGMGVEQIVESFVTKMGKQVRAAPTLKGLDLTAWVMPFAILGLGLVAVTWVIVRMARPSNTAPAAVEAQAVDPRIDEELRQFEEES
jgi:cytochrome c-type biogenesis protein CcmH